MQGIKIASGGGNRFDPVDTRVSATCPGCQKFVTFDPLEVHDLQLSIMGEAHWAFRFVQRTCPDPECRTHIFAVVRGDGALVRVYPPERVPFDTNGVPSAIVGPFEEALGCHAARCYIAAAIMVRKTLEHLCEENGAKGSNLKDRLKALGSRIIVPPKLVAGLDNLRLLGNDAAHFELQTFDDVGEREVSVAIKLTKELLKATYQYDDLIGELEALKKKKP